MYVQCTINEGCTCTIYIARRALNHKKQNTFIRYLHIYLATSVESFQSLLFILPPVEKYQRGEKILFVENARRGVGYTYEDSCCWFQQNNRSILDTAIRTTQAIQISIFCIVE